MCENICPLQEKKNREGKGEKGEGREKKRRRQRRKIFDEGKYFSLQRRRKAEREKEENLSKRKMSRWADRQRGNCEDRARILYSEFSLVFPESGV